MNFEEFKNRQRIFNLKEVRRDINKKWVENKISKYIERNSFLNYSIEDIKEQILTNDIIASFFMKDPSKQNFIEKAIANIIKENDKVDNFINYSSKALKFVINGKIVNKRIKDDIKSIDYYWKTNNKEIYATQKYTNEKGGAQDNQKNDVINFLKNAIKNNNENIVFFAILDGEYYNDKIFTLKNKYENKNVKVCKIEELNERLKEI